MLVMYLFAATYFATHSVFFFYTVFRSEGGAAALNAALSIIDTVLLVSVGGVVRHVSSTDMA